MQMTAGMSHNCAKKMVNGNVFRNDTSHKHGGSLTSFAVYYEQDVINIWREQDSIESPEIDFNSRPG